MKQLSADFFRANRERAMAQLDGGILVAPAYSSMQRGNDASFAFEQEANFWWLAGVNQPDWWLVIDASRAHAVLVASQVDEVHALFDGALGHDEAQKISGVDEVMSAEAGNDYLRQLARAHKLVYTVDQPPHEYFDFTLNPAALAMRQRLERLFATVQDFRPKLAKLRAIKSKQEIAVMQTAIDLTTHAFTKTQQNMTTYSYEYEIEADFTHFFRSRGASGHAYDPIVAAGKNACTMHYVDNNTKLKKGDFVLLDIGARTMGYAADITRTYAYGEVTKRQREVHEAVERAQQEIIALLAPGVSVMEYHEKVDVIMKRELVTLGLISDDNDEKYRHYFPHAISHGLGVDVHDALGRPRVFEPGMVLTVEPGIYIPEEGIGVRIEDDILITSHGHKNLSAKLPTGM